MMGSEESSLVLSLEMFRRQRALVEHAAWFVDFVDRLTILHSIYVCLFGSLKTTVARRRV